MTVRKWTRVRLPCSGLPIVVSAVIVFVASNILWMALPFGHRHDYGRLPDEKSVLSALTRAGSTSRRWSTGKRPQTRSGGRFTSGRSCSFSSAIQASSCSGKRSSSTSCIRYVVAIFVGYLAGHARGPAAPYLSVFRIVGTAGFLAFGFRTVSDAVWYGKPWIVVFKEMIDGLIYGLLMAGTFGWLWPR